MPKGGIVSWRTETRGRQTSCANLVLCRGEAF